MITENEIRNQYAIAQQVKKEEGWDDELDKWSLLGYIHALGFMLGTLKPKFDKGDI